MKKYILLFVIVTLCAIACRKLVPRDLGLPAAVDPCYNGQMDGNETGVDCGSSECIPCAQTVAPCTLVTDELKISTNGVTLNTKTLINKSIDSTGGIWKFTAYTNPSYYLFIRFDSKPSVTTIYDGTSNSTLGANEVFVTYYQPGLENLTGVGEVYVNFDSGTYTITSCDFGFHLPAASAPSFTQSFKLTLN